MTTADEARVAEIRERAEKATEGPWDHTGQHVWCAEGTQECCGRGMPLTDDGIEVTGYVCCGQPEVNWQQVQVAESGETDADFIAHAREDIPWLLSQLTATLARAEAAEKERDGLRAINDAMRDQFIPMQAEICSLTARIQQLEAALEPFADLAQHCGVRSDYCGLKLVPTEIGPHIKVGDLRRAAACRAQADGQKEKTDE